MFGNGIIPLAFRFRRVGEGVSWLPKYLFQLHNEAGPTVVYLDGALWCIDHQRGKKRLVRVVMAITAVCQQPWPTRYLSWTQRIP